MHFLKRTVENGGKADSDENALKNVVVQAERPLRQEEENSQPQNRAEVMSQPERTIPGAWANTVNANGLGLRWGRIVTKRGPYPWELERSIIVVPVKRPLCYRSIPVICKHCKQLHCLVGWWYESEKECCIYHMVNHRNWRLK